MQCTSHILLIRPTGFRYNPETAGSNAFQRKTDADEVTVRQQVLAEFDSLADKLKSKGVDVVIVEDTPSPEKPDAIFPNNWVSFHPDGRVILYPLYAENRRYERRIDIIESLKKKFVIREIIDLSDYEKQNRFLESTGSMIFDHVNKIAYACLSPRTNKMLFIQVCKVLEYTPVHFKAHDELGKEIYHTNVMMCVGEEFSVVCLGSITDLPERNRVVESLKDTGHVIVDITHSQMNHFAGNMLALRTQDGAPLLVASQSAVDCLNKEQKHLLEKYAELLPLSIPTIETLGGGSARCMIAEVFLQPNGKGAGFSTK